MTFSDFRKKMFWTKNGQFGLKMANWGFLAGFKPAIGIGLSVFRLSFCVLSTSLLISHFKFWGNVGSIDECLIKTFFIYDDISSRIASHRASRFSALGWWFGWYSVGCYKFSKFLYLEWDRIGSQDIFDFLIFDFWFYYVWIGIGWGVRNFQNSFA